MKAKVFLFIGVLAFFSTTHFTNAQSTAWTYQGSLSDEDGPVNGLYNLSFALFSSENSVTPLLSVTNENVEVLNGVFSSTLDFGPSVFNGADYWLEIGVESSEANEYSILSPRQLLNPVPYSLFAFRSQLAHSVMNGIVSDMSFFGTTTADPLVIYVDNAQALRIEPDPLGPYVFYGSPNIVGGFMDNLVTAGVRGATIGGGGTDMTTEMDLLRNSVLADFGTVSGGLGNQAGGFATTIGGGQENRISSGLNTYGEPRFDTISGGEANTITSAGKATIAGGRKNVILTNSIGSVISGGEDNRIYANTKYSVIGGGVYNQILGGSFADSSTISGGKDNLIEQSTAYGSISGGHINLIQDNSDGATISGGEFNSISNFAQSATIGGGYANVIGSAGDNSIIAGGIRNQIGLYASGSVISGGSGNRIGQGDLRPAFTSVMSGTIGGGGANEIGDEALFSTISGGRQNIIRTNAQYSTVSGGSGNSIAPNALGATIPGGRANHASGRDSFAAGRNAHAQHDGVFIWADSTERTNSVGMILPIIFDSHSTNEFAARATGGVRFITGIDTDGTPISGVSIPSGGTGWSIISDRNLKENVEQVNGREVLQQVADLPLSTWNMKSQAASIRHIGPMAQDFHAAFGLGESDRRINTVDADGVALAAIQGLHALVKDQEVALAKKNAQIEELTRSLVELMERVERLEQEATP